MTDKTPSAVAEQSLAKPEEANLFSGLSQDLMMQLTPAKNRMILMYLTGQYSQKKIAAVVGVSENTIRAWLMDETVQAVIKELQAREWAIAESRLKAMKFKAIDTMDDLLDSTMDNVRFQAAKDILDRGGHKAQQNIKVEKTVTNLEQTLSNLSSFNVDEADVIDISDFTELVKNG